MTRARNFANVISGNFDLPATALDNAGGAGLIHLNTTSLTSSDSANSISFTQMDSSAYSHYVIICRCAITTDSIMYARFLDSSDAEITGTNYYQYTGSTSSTQMTLHSDVVGDGANNETGFHGRFDISIKQAAANKNVSPSVLVTAGMVENAGTIFLSQNYNHLRPDLSTTQPEGIKIYLSSTDTFKHAVFSLFAYAES